MTTPKLLTIPGWLQSFLKMGNTLKPSLEKFFLIRPYKKISPHWLSFAKLNLKEWRTYSLIIIFYEDIIPYLTSFG
jgi:hypothetical protein